MVIRNICHRHQYPVFSHLDATSKNNSLFKQSQDQSSTDILPVWTPFLLPSLFICAYLPRDTSFDRHLTQLMDILWGECKLRFPLRKPPHPLFHYPRVTAAGRERENFNAGFELRASPPWHRQVLMCLPITQSSHRSLCDMKIAVVLNALCTGPISGALKHYNMQMWHEQTAGKSGTIDRPPISEPVEPSRGQRRLWEEN